VTDSKVVLSDHLELIERNIFKKDHENPMNGYDSTAAFVFY
jgi:hypothetical protein